MDAAVRSQMRLKTALPRLSTVELLHCLSTVELLHGLHRSRPSRRGRRRDCRADLPGRAHGQTSCCPGWGSGPRVQVALIPNGTRRAHPKPRHPDGGKVATSFWCRFLVPAAGRRQSCVGMQFHLRLRFARTARRGGGSEYKDPPPPTNLFNAGVLGSQQAS